MNTTTAEFLAVELRPEVLDLHWFESDVMSQGYIDTAADRKREGVLAGAGRVAPRFAAAEQSLRIRIETLVPPVEAGSKHAGEKLVVKPAVCIGVTAEIGNRAQPFVDVYSK
jgi:hypothetical protein